MDFLKARFDWDTGRGVLVQRTEMPSKFELFVDIDRLVSKD